MEYIGLERPRDLGSIQYFGRNRIVPQTKLIPTAMTFSLV